MRDYDCLKVSLDIKWEKITLRLSGGKLRYKMRHKDCVEVSLDIRWEKITLKDFYI
jgi:hypothetical protein